MKLLLLLLIGVTSVAVQAQMTFDISAGVGISGHITGPFNSSVNLVNFESVAPSYRTAASVSIADKSGRNIFSGGLGYASYGVDQFFSFPDTTGASMGVPPADRLMLTTVNYRIHVVELPVRYRRYFNDRKVRPYAEVGLIPTLKFRTIDQITARGPVVNFDVNDVSNETAFLLFAGASFGLEIDFTEALSGFAQIQGRANLPLSSVRGFDNFWDTGLQVGIRMSI